MAARVVELITCDKCGTDASLDHTDVTVRWQGREYRLDLCDTHYNEVSYMIERVTQLGERSEVRERRMKRLRKLYDEKVKQR